MINNQYVNQKSYKSGLHPLRYNPPDTLNFYALACSLTFQRNAGSNAYTADAERIPCNGLFYAMARNALHGLFLPVRISMYACTLAVTNPDTVKRICSTLCRAALRPARDVVSVCLRLVFVSLACAYSYRGMRMAGCDVLNKNILNKKIAALRRPCAGCLQFERACLIRPKRYGLFLYPLEHVRHGGRHNAQLIGYRGNA